MNNIQVQDIRCVFDEYLFTNYEPLYTCDTCSIVCHNNINEITVRNTNRNFIKNNIP